MRNKIKICAALAVAGAALCGLRVSRHKVAEPAEREVTYKYELDTGKVLAQSVDGYWGPARFAATNLVNSNRLAGSSSFTNWIQIPVPAGAKDCAVQWEFQVPTAVAAVASYLYLGRSVDPTTYTNGQATAKNTIEQFARIGITPGAADTLSSGWTNISSVSGQLGAFPYLYIGPVTNAEAATSYMTNLAVYVKFK